MLGFGEGAGLKSWDIRTGNELFHQPKVVAPLVSAHNERVLALALPGESTIRLLDSRTGEELDTLDAHGEEIKALCYSPDDRFLVASDWRGQITLWEPATKVVHKTWNFGPVEDIAFSPDGRYLATANANGTAYLLEVPEGLRR